MLQMTVPRLDKTQLERSERRQRCALPRLSTTAHRRLNYFRGYSNGIVAHVELSGLSPRLRITVLPGVDLTTLSDASTQNRTHRVVSHLKNRPPHVLHR
jgi:hypothetical protein